MRSGMFKINTCTMADNKGGGGGGMGGGLDPNLGIEWKVTVFEVLSSNVPRRRGNT